MTAETVSPLLVAASPDGTPEYGGLYRVSIDGNPVADFVPGSVWTLTLMAMQAEFSPERVTYEWVPFDVS